MNALKMGLVMLVTAVVTVLSVPLVWIGLALMSFILTPVLSVFALVGLIIAKVRERTSQMPRVRLLLIDNEVETHAMVDRLMGAKWSIDHVVSSYRGIGKILSNHKAASGIDFVLIRWSRRYLSGEWILDYIDEAMAIRRRRGQLGPVARGLPPILFLRKAGARPYQLRRSHTAHVLGCVALDREKLIEEVLRHVG